ncbi:alpha/beta-hydrolase [Lophiostoma macrostomum CBS 122681]|uniref:Alpha/beta-hydrolase n=1 Tax=Lophiostoma macrostomum CBS 122681 TaxID=1314788 RepID=A0A6A6TTP4_9PLEO|nr:alpha/beta-hydrolase [Lophiostoma macrostomum CBS 122681]
MLLVRRKYTIILLHGRGSTADKFAAPLLQHPITQPNDNQTSTFHSHFPHTKFIVPTASLRRAVAYNRALTHQWFDLYPLDAYTPEHKQHVQIPGLKESVEYVHGLVRDAVQDVGAGNVVVMGLSQGCAVGLIAMLLWEGERLGGFVGMCGWLPLRREMLDVVSENDSQDEEEEDGGGLFERDQKEALESRGRSRYEQAVDWLGGELETSMNASPRRDRAEAGKIPIFLGHRNEDEKVPFWLEYQGLAHRYSSNMLQDIIYLLRESRANLHSQVVS